MIVGLFRTPTTPIMKSLLVVDIVVLGEVLVPVALLGDVNSNGEAVLAPLTAKATADEESPPETLPLSVIVIVIEPIVGFKAQKVCNVLELEIAVLAL